jgi:hypothetical protein
MALSEFETKKIEKVMLSLLKPRLTPHVKSGGVVSYCIKGHEVLLFSTKPSQFNPTQNIESAIAKFKYVRTTNTWHLFWQRATLKWQSYKPLPTAKSIEALAQEVSTDQYCCFWG